MRSTSIPNSRTTLFAALAEVDGSGRADRGPGHQSAAIRTLRTGLLSTVAVLALAGAPAFADGGDGGGRDGQRDGGPGGTSSLTGDGGNGNAGIVDGFSIGGGGGGGAGITAAGAGSAGTERDEVNDGAAGAGGAGGASAGADGEDGGDGEDSDSRSGGGGGGGAGAAGLVAGSGGLPSVNVTGGSGGSGGTGGSVSDTSGSAGGGGGGGAGGYGFVFTGTGTTTLPVLTFQGGSGGTGGNGGRGGTIDTGGRGGGGGGDGGIGLLIQGAGVDLVIPSTVAGGDGGDGGRGGDAAPGFKVGEGGAGDNGGDGLTFRQNAAATIDGSVTGGGGGNGGASGNATGLARGIGGAAGAGGNGVVLGAGGNVAVSGVVTGGAGGDGGESTNNTNGVAGGAGGAGLLAANGGTVVVSGTAIVTGGAGGSGGSSAGSDGADGAGGVGLLGANLTVILKDNASMSGGLGGDGTTRANAIEFTSGTNVLRLETDSVTVTGDVVANGTDDRLVYDIASDFDANMGIFGSTLRGFESFEKAGTSTLTLIGTTKEMTPWLVSAGTLAISDGASLGTPAGVLTLNGGTLAVTADTAVGNNVAIGANNGTISVANGVAVTASGVFSGTGAFTKTGAGTLTLTGTNSYSGGTTVTAGTLIGNAASLQGNIVNNAALTFDQAGVGTYTDVISGNGALTKAGAGELILTGDSSAYAGTTDIAAGLLTINGALGGTVNITGGAVGGSGTITNLSIASGGTLSPGNSIGTLNAVNLTLAAGSTYEVELKNGGFVAGINNDFVNATGTVTINGGKVNVTPENGTDTGSTYTPGTYTIVTAAGGVTGTFDTLSDNYAFLDFALGYDANNVRLTSSVAVTSFCLTGMSANQCAAGEGAFSLGTGNGVFDAVLALSNAKAPGALDQLSGEIHASAGTALLEDSRFPREATFNRLRFALDGVGAGTTGQAGTAMSDSFAVWGQGLGSWGDRDSNGNAAAMDRALGGITLGGDALVRENVRLGLMGGYSQSSLDLDDRASSATVDSYTLGAYAGGAWDRISLKGGLAHSWHSLHTARSVAFTGFSDSLSASYNARTFQAYTEASYSIDRGQARFEPYANLAYVNLDADGYTETGGTAALTSAGQNSSATFTTLGIRGETEVALGETKATLSGGLGWRHAFGDTPAATHNLAGGSAFTVTGGPLGRDALVLDAGFAVNLSGNASFGLSYNGQLGSGISDHGGKASLNVRF